MTKPVPARRSHTADMLFGMGGKLLYALTRVGLPPLALAHMGLGEYGLWSACFVLVAYLGMAASGFTLVYLRGAAQCHARGDIAGIGRLLSTGLAAMGTLALLLLGGVWLALPALLALFNVDPAQRPLASQLWLGATAVFLADMSLGAFANVLHAVGRVREEQRVWVLSFLLEAVLIALLLWAGWGVHALLAAFAARYAFAALANALLARRALPGLVLSWRGFDASLLRGFFRYGAAMQASGLLATALHSADRLIAGLLLGPQATALFDLAAKVPTTAGSVGSSASGVAVSASARHDAAGQDGGDGVRQVYFETSRVTVASLALALPLIAWFATPITLAWLGAGEAQAAVAPLMACLAAGLHLHLLTGPATATQRGRGRLGADFSYHGLRAAALALAVAAWLGSGAAGIGGLALAIASAQGAAAVLFLAWAHRRVAGGWAGIGTLLVAPTLASHLLAAVLHALLAEPAAAGRADALLHLLQVTLLWLPAVALLLGALLLSAAERRALLQRVTARLARQRIGRPA